MRVDFILGLALLGLSGATISQAADIAPKVIDHISIPDGGWDYASMDEAAGRLLVARTKGVMAMDLTSRQITPILAPGARVHGVIRLPNSPLAVSTNGETNNALLFDAMTGAEVATIATGTNPDAVWFEPKSGLIAVMNGKSQDVSLIDPATRTVTATVMVGGKLEFAASDGKGLLFINVEDKSEIAVLDVPAAKILRRIKLPGCEEPTGLAYDAAYGALITVCGGGQVLVITPANDKITATIPVGKGGDAVIYDDARHLAFIPCGQAANLSTIKIEAGGKAGLIAVTPTQKGARTGAIDPKTGNVYLPVAKYDPPKDGGRPTPIPGSTELLVVSTKD
jgi:YVTN family beta-propeller protein